MRVYPPVPWTVTFRLEVNVTAMGPGPETHEYDGRDVTEPAQANLEEAFKKAFESEDITLVNVEYLKAEPQ